MWLTAQDDVCLAVAGGWYLFLVLHTQRFPQAPCPQSSSSSVSGASCICQLEGSLALFVNGALRGPKEHSLTKQIEVSLAIHLPLDQFQTIELSFHLAI